MSTLANMWRPDRADSAAGAARTSPGQDLATVALAAWLMLGLFVDGWAHNNAKPESFFTPWHGLFYSGFLATALWHAYLLRRLGRPPIGYRLGFVGVAMFAVGGVGDLIWHEIFGIEVDLEALFSPSHLVLFAGALAILTSPFRAAWVDRRPQSQIRLGPALASLALATALVSFFLMPYSPFFSQSATSHVFHVLALDPDAVGHVAPAVTEGQAWRNAWHAEEVRKGGLGGFLITTVVLMAPALLLARRWRLSETAYVALFAGVALAMSGVGSFALWATVPVTLLGGIVAGRFSGRATPGSNGGNEFPGAAGVDLRRMGFFVPAAIWTGYFGLLALSDGVGWSVELWGGVVVMSAMTGYALAWLMTLTVPQVQPSD
ncbi:MAG: hypothetical protein ACT4OS_04525 [Acidimicrobiales bacterium]